MNGQQQMKLAASSNFSKEVPNSMSVPIHSLITQLGRLVGGFRLGSKGRLHCKCSPPPLDSYIPWLVKVFRLEAPELLYASVYLKRLHLLQRRPRIVQPCTPYRLVLAALTVAHKYLRDNSYTNVDWGRGFCLPKKDVDKVELAMLKLLKWELRASDEELHSVKTPPRRTHKHLVRRPRLRREDAMQTRWKTG